MNTKLLKQIKDWIAEGKEYKCYQLQEWRGRDGLRVRAMKRDRYECQDCKANGKQSRVDEVHHIIALKDNPSKFLDLDNVVCLCTTCHNKRHNRYFNGSKSKIITEERW